MKGKYDEADREDAEEAYGDFMDVVDAVKDALADMRDRFARTLEGDAVEEYESVVRARREKALAMARIEDYAMIGDLQTAALVERGGSIDWLCFPRFDSAACFAALLGEPENGRWLLAPTAGGTTSRRYRGETLILETTWENDEGAVRVCDFMPPRGQGAGRRSHRRGHPRQGRDALRARHPLRLRAHRAVGAARRPRPRRRRRP